MSSNTLPQVAREILPGLANDSWTYIAKNNIFLSTGWSTSRATYYEALRLSKRIAVFYDIGEGEYRTFLNGVKVFGLTGDGHVRLIGQRQWGGYNNWRDFSESFARQSSIGIISDFLMGEAKRLGCNASREEANNYAEALVRETEQKLLNYNK